MANCCQCPTPRMWFKPLGYVWRCFKCGQMWTICMIQAPDGFRRWEKF